MKKNSMEIVLMIIIILIVGFIIYTVKNNDILSNDKDRFFKEEPKINNDDSIIYKGVKEIINNEKIIKETFTDDKTDTNILLLSNEINVDMDNVTINKKGDTNNPDNSSFYGINSGLLIKDQASLNINDSSVFTDGLGANGIFSYNSKVVINNTTINTDKDLSGGIMVAGNGNIDASNLEIKTKGNSSAAIRSDRGGGVITVNEGVYETNGVGSPAIYSTANITVKNAKLKSNHSEGIIIEGKNAIFLDNVEVEDNNDTLNGKSTTYKNIFIYQSMSGDATNGKATLEIKNSSINTNKGDTIYVTNTEADIVLENNLFSNVDDEGYFLRIKKDSWGIDGMNGGVVNISFNNQSATGNIYVDDISTLNITLSNGSYYEGTINGDKTAAKVELELDKKSKIKLTGDSYITAINDSNRAYTNIDFNGYKLYVSGTPIN